MANNTLRLLLTTVPGLEEIVEQDIVVIKDIESLFYKKLSGRVYVSIRENTRLLHKFHNLRSIERIILLLCRGNVEDIRTNIDKELIMAYLGPWMTFMVKTLRLGNHEISSIDFSSIIGNIIQKMSFQKNGKIAEVSLSDPDIIFYLEIIGSVFQLGIDLTGFNALHRREYRAYLHPSALNPLIAYAMCKLSNVKQQHRILDPMCGSGTILIESKKINPTIEAWGLDINPKHIIGAQRNAKQANLNINFKVCDIIDIDQLFQPEYFDIIAVNPPYGLREKSIYDIPSLYALLIKKSQKLLKKKGILCILTPRKKLVIKLLNANNFIIKKILSIRHGGLTSHIIVSLKT